eukprot:gnl/TRDRNA2_/TRDRNA2_57686_c0_seq1.p1 gnl/TRDRNA2_/TRDRNA2_57686_c0~~gnl/TRDRNA2_/TRDRNA2_57686_c0_seq1.p1  ORF type:complete len:372 (-),score=29.57 gnl/TRDRNA2_/TRDRNA2_57686_c0_seq1:434-1549(-)
MEDPSGETHPRGSGCPAVGSGALDTRGPELRATSAAPTVQQEVSGAPGDATRQHREDEFQVSVSLALNGEHLCVVQRPAVDLVGSLFRAVTSVAPQASAFDLLLGDQILSPSYTLLEAGLYDGAVVRLLRRKLKAADVTVAQYSENCLGSLCFVYIPSGAELRLRGARAGADRCGETRLSMFCELYVDGWLADEADEVFAYYSKTINESTYEGSVTTRVTAKRPLRIRSDTATAKQAEGSMWVTLHAHKTASDEPRVTAKRPLRIRSDTATAKQAEGSMWVTLHAHKTASDEPDQDIFSGMRLEILDASSKEWLHVKTPSHGSGWVRRRDVVGVGEWSLDWAGPETVIDEYMAPQTAIPVYVGGGYAMREP